MMNFIFEFSIIIIVGFIDFSLKYLTFYPDFFMVGLTPCLSVTLPFILSFEFPVRFIWLFQIVQLLTLKFFLSVISKSKFYTLLKIFLPL